jgi:hypothetical protein
VTEEKKRFPLGIPQLVGLIVLVLFIPWVIMTGRAERETRRTIESYEPFAAPAFPMSFSKTAPFDPLGFMGNGITAGFWKWTPQGLELTDMGRNYFSDTPQQISAVVGAGRRAISSFGGYQDKEGKRDVRFHWRWTEVTPPAQVLLSRPPKMSEDYDGHAVLVRKDGQWHVDKLETPDFDAPMTLLRETAAGIKH